MAKYGKQYVSNSTLILMSLALFLIIYVLLFNQVDSFQYQYNTVPTRQAKYYNLQSLDSYNTYDDDYVNPTTNSHDFYLQSSNNRMFEPIV